MISEQIFDKSEQLVSYCFDILKKNSKKIQYNQQKLFIMHPKEFVDTNAYKPPEDELIVDERIDDYVQIAKSILKSNGFVIDESNNNYNVELHINNANIVPQKSIFDIHCDDFGGIECNVNTLIIYFNVNCKGGELAFYENEFNLKPKQLISTQNPTESTCKVVMFEGNLWHNSMNYQNGQRYLISFQIPTIRD